MALQNRQADQNPKAAFALPTDEPLARHWDARTLQDDGTAHLYELTTEALTQIGAALEFAKANGLAVDTVEQEDFRIPAFSTEILPVRRRIQDPVSQTQIDTQGNQQDQPAKPFHHLTSSEFSSVPSSSPAPIQEISKSEMPSPQEVSSNQALSSWSSLTVRASASPPI